VADVVQTHMGFYLKGQYIKTKHKDKSGAKKEGPVTHQSFPRVFLYVEKVENWKVQVKGQEAFPRFSSLHTSASDICAPLTGPLSACWGR
jgi:hypothetical protein